MNKKGAEESNMIIFIILALVVVGLVIWFTFGFFNKGTDLLDMNDLVTIGAVQSCQQEINLNQLDGYCYSPKEIKMKDGSKRTVNCWFIERNFKESNFTGVGTLGTCNPSKFVGAQCYLLNITVGEAETNNTYVNSEKCKDVLNAGEAWVQLNP